MQEGATSGVEARHARNGRGSMTPNIAILAGESSGDGFGARLAAELHRAVPGLRVWGLGGDRMRRAGVDVIEDIHGWAAIGIVESLRVAPRLRFRVLPKLQRAIGERRPSVVIPIDFGAFNVPVARWCKSRGHRVLYFLPPGSWRRSGPPPYGLAAATDAIATQFPWSEERLRQAGANATFVGHPLLDIVRPTEERDRFIESIGLDPHMPIVALLPGSRRAELTHTSPALADAARMMTARLPGLQFVTALAGSGASSNPGWTPEPLQALADAVGHGSPRVAIVRGRTHDALAHADAAVVCSGTATLEAAILGVPMVIIYRGSRLMRIEYALRRVSRIEHIGLPNIIANRRIMPELVADAATPEAIAEHTMRYLLDQEAAVAARRDLEHVRLSLGEPGACRRAADMALQLAGLAGAPVTQGHAQANVGSGAAAGSLL